MSLLIYLPNELIKLIEYHLNAMIIQCLYKINRPLSLFEHGDRVMIINKKKGKILGTILTIEENYCKIKLLPRIIPNWKRCNLSFWLNYQHFLKDYSFPYYIPKPIKITKNKLVKLFNWKENIEQIDGSIRIQMKENNFEVKKSNMFKFFI